jgi:hypothetical protein
MVGWTGRHGRRIGGGGGSVGVESALKAAVAVMCETESLERWSAISVLTGGMWLAPLNMANAPRTRVFSAAAEERLMSVIDAADGKRPP